MVTGFNTDVQHDGKIYHVQTEDKGVDNPLIEIVLPVGIERQISGEGSIILLSPLYLITN